MKPIKMYVDKKYSMGLRIIFLFAAFYFLKDIYDAISTGIAISGHRVVALSENSRSFYSILFKQAAFAFVFLLFAFYSVKTKPEEGGENAELDSKSKEDGSSQ